MLATANEAGGAGFGQQLLDTLQVFDEVTVQTKLVEANAEAIAATAGRTSRTTRRCGTRTGWSSSSTLSHQMRRSGRSGHWG